MTDLSSKLNILSMNDKKPKLDLFLQLHRAGLIKPLVRYSRKIRQEILRSVHLNTDLITNQLTAIDLVTDSLKELVLLKRDFVPQGYFESGFIKLQEIFQHYFGYPYVIPMAQGRTAELILARSLLQSDMYVPNNLLFITTRHHQMLAGGHLVEIPIPESFATENNHPFKGNLDVEKLKEIINKYGPKKIAYIYLEMSVNASGGHPVSMANLKSVYKLAQENGILVFLDACRILENAYFIREREKGYENRTLRSIVKEICSFSDGCTMSATKDFFVDSGAFLATHKKKLYEQFLDNVMIVGDGLPVRAKGALAWSLKNSFHNKPWIKNRIDKVKVLHSLFRKEGLPVLEPVSGYAVFLNVESLSEDIPSDQYPQKAFLAALYEQSGILGSENMLTQRQIDMDMRIIRFALPLRHYSAKDMAYVAKEVGSLWRNRKQIKGLTLTSAPNCASGHFLAQFEYVQPAP